MGQLNRPLGPGPQAADLPATPTRPALEFPTAPAPTRGDGTPAGGRPAAPERPTATAPLGRVSRPPLEPPQLGQVNRPLVPPAGDVPQNEPAGPGPSGLPAAVRPWSEPVTPDGGDDDAPSGLPPRPHRGE
jgi:hypothetical protein